MSVNDVSEIVIEDSRVTLQIVPSLIVNSGGVVYNHMFIVQAIGGDIHKTSYDKLKIILKREVPSLQKC
jgi:hypothetical protein